MARYDVYANPHAPDRKHTPFVLDVQNDHLGPLGTRVVIPLRTLRGFGKPAQGLNPVIAMAGQSLILDTASLAPVPANMLKQALHRAATSRDDIQDALDTLFGSY